MHQSFIKSPQSFKKVILLFLFIFVTCTAISIAVNLLYSLVLITYGARAMPLMILFLGITELISILLFTLRKNYAKKTSIVNISLIMLILIFLCTYAIAAPMGLPIFYAIAFIALQSLAGIIVPQFDMIIANLFSVAEFKTVYPRITSAYSIGTIVGGLLLAILSSLYGSSLPLLLVSALFALSLVLSITIYRLYKMSLSNKKEVLALEYKRIFIDRETDENILTRSKWSIQSVSGGLREIGESFVYLFREKILFQIILYTLLAFTAYRFFSFLFDSFVNLDLSEHDITPFFAILDVVLSIGSLVFRLFLSSSLIKRISFTRGYILQSSFMLMGLGGMVYLFFTTHTQLMYLYAAILYVLFQITIINRETSENVAFSLIPRIHRDKARTLANSIGDSLAYIISALFVIGIVNLFTLEHILIFSLLIALLYFISSFYFPRSVYAHIGSLLKTKKHNDLDDVIEVLGERKGRCFEQDLMVMYPQAQMETRGKILATMGDFRTQKSYDFLMQEFFHRTEATTLPVIQALSQIKGNHAFLLMYLIYTKAPPEVLEQAIRYFLRYHERKIRELISTDFLRSKDNDIKIIAMHFIQRCRQSEELDIIQEYTREYHPVRLITQALFTLYTVAPRRRSYVLSRISQLLHSKKKENELAALQLIGKLSLRKMRNQILTFIDNEADAHIRSKALYALAHIDVRTAIQYFAYYLGLPKEANTHLVREFILLPLHLRLKIIDKIVALPVSAIEVTIRFFLPHRLQLKLEIELLYFSIGQRFHS